MSQKDVKPSEARRETCLDVYAKARFSKSKGADISSVVKEEFDKMVCEINGLVARISAEYEKEKVAKDEHGNIVKDERDLSGFEFQEDDQALVSSIIESKDIIVTQVFQTKPDLPHDPPVDPETTRRAFSMWRAAESVAEDYEKNSKDKTKRECENWNEDWKAEAARKAILVGLLDRAYPINPSKGWGYMA